MKRPALQNKQVGVLRMAFRASGYYDIWIRYTVWSALLFPFARTFYKENCNFNYIELKGWPLGGW